MEDFMLVRKENKIIRRRSVRENKKHLMKEGPGAGLLITMYGLRGECSKAVLSKDGTMDVYLKNVSLENCAIHNYYWSTEEFDYDQGKAIITIDFSDLSIEDQKEYLNDIKKYGLDLGACTLVYGGGWSRSSLRGEIECRVYEGKHGDWNRLQSPLYYKFDYPINIITLDFGDDLEDTYQETENMLIEDED